MNPGEQLSSFHGAWVGQQRDHGVSISVVRRVQTFLQSRPAVLHLDELINKKDPLQVRYVMMRLIEERAPVQVIFMQGALPLQHDDLFPRLLDLLSTCPVWSANLGELRFSDTQCAKLANALRMSGVTHLFYECTVAGHWKDVYRNAIRDNRAKHGLWRFGPDAEQNRVILAAIKSWYVPTSHRTNKQWAARNVGGWTSVERVQCEACGKWRRLPPNVDGWPHTFYCSMNTWDVRFATCEAAEEVGRRAARKQPRQPAMAHGRRSLGSQYCPPLSPAARAPTTR
jgi:hypothetical protein